MVNCATHSLSTLCQRSWEAGAAVLVDDAREHVAAVAADWSFDGAAAAAAVARTASAQVAPMVAPIKVHDGPQQQVLRRLHAHLSQAIVHALRLRTRFHQRREGDVPASVASIRSSVSVCQSSA